MEKRLKIDQQMQKVDVIRDYIKEQLSQMKQNVAVSSEEQDISLLEIRLEIESEVLILNERNQRLKESKERILIELGKGELRQEKVEVHMHFICCFISS